MAWAGTTKPDALTRAKKLIDEYCLSEFTQTDSYEDLRSVSLGFTTITDYEIPIQVYANLIDFQIIRELDGKYWVITQYDSLDELIEAELENLDFSCLVDVQDEILICLDLVPADFTTWA